MPYEALSEARQVLQLVWRLHSARAASAQLVSTLELVVVLEVTVVVAFPLLPVVGVQKLRHTTRQHT